MNKVKHNAASLSHYQHLIERDEQGAVTEQGLQNAHNMMLAAMVALLDTRNRATPDCAMMCVPPDMTMPPMVSIVARGEIAERLTAFLIALTVDNDNEKTATRH